MRILLILSLLSLAGCSKGDPETSRLRAGQECLAADREVPPAGFEKGAIPLIRPEPRPASPLDWPVIAVGTRVLVVKDEDKGEDNPLRGVVVKVRDGDHAEMSGIMMRWSLRPVE